MSTAQHYNWLYLGILHFAVCQQVLTNESFQTIHLVLIYKSHQTIPQLLTDKYFLAELQRGRRANYGAGNEKG